MCQVLNQQHISEETDLDPNNEIGVFVQVDELRNFTKVADSPEMSSATVSRVNSLIEFDLGVKLLERPTRQVSPAPGGLTFYGRCKAILRQLDEAKTG
jgi:DNA-binding transcriptional LysR family regulator